MRGFREPPADVKISDRYDEYMDMRGDILFGCFSRLEDKLKLYVKNVEIKYAGVFPNYIFIVTYDDKKILVKPYVKA